MIRGISLSDLVGHQLHPRNIVLPCRVRASQAPGRTPRPHDLLANIFSAVNCTSESSEDRGWGACNASR